MNVYQFTNDEYVLFLGEGNFSFSLSLIKNLKDSKYLNDISRVYSSCFESEPTGETKNNIDALKEIGANIIIGLDATSLSSNEMFADFKFHRILFNFPHVGGKMKIHLNRFLIQQFFVSSRTLLRSDGLIIVALCAGQGGTGAEIIPRRWDDSWQIVEMAGHANYILRTIEPFPHEVFQNYVSYGFKGIAKSFNTKNALVHVFSISTCEESWSQFQHAPISYYLNLHSMAGYSNLLLPHVYHYLLSNTHVTSVQKYIVNCLIDLFDFRDFESVHFPLTISVTSDSGNTECLLDGEKQFLRKSLLEALPEPDTLPEHFISEGVVFLPLKEKFSMSPLKYQMVLCLPNGQEIVCDALFKLFKLFKANEKNFKWSSNDGKLELLLEYSGKAFVIGTVLFVLEKSFITLDVDMICVALYNLQHPKQLWNGNVEFSSNKLITTLYPPQFTFDINFIKSPEFSVDKFIYLLWQIGGLVIESVLMLNSFKNPGTHKESVCYRIVYKSYQIPFYRKRAVEFHEKVIGHALRESLNVEIT